MEFARGGRMLERLAGTASGGGGSRPPARWTTRRAGRDPWKAGEAGDQAWLRKPAPSLAREALQHALLFPAARVLARPRVIGAEGLMHTPQPAVLAPNHESDLDTPLVLLALPRAWRSRTVVGAASDRFYRDRLHAISSALWINTFPFDRAAGERRGLALAASFLRDDHNVLLYPQGTRGAGPEGFRLGVAELCITTRAPLIPIHVGGSALIMPKGRGLDRRGTTTVTFSSPLYPRAGETPAQLTGRLSAAIDALAGVSSRRRAAGVAT